MTLFEKVSAYESFENIKLPDQFNLNQTKTQLDPILAKINLEHCKKAKTT